MGYYVFVIVSSSGMVTKSKVLWDENTLWTKLPMSGVGGCPSPCAVLVRETVNDISSYTFLDAVSENTRKPLPGIDVP